MILSRHSDALRRKPEFRNYQVVQGDPTTEGRWQHEVDGCDAVVNLVVASELYARFPTADEGALSRLRASLVSGASLARIALHWQLGDVVRLGPGELKTGGFRRESILADALEGICGALYLDAGLDAARPLVLRLLAPALEQIDASDALKDAKTRLQEWLQARGAPLPAYTLERVSGESHEQHFTVRCETSEPAASALGEGSSRRRAERFRDEPELPPRSAGTGEPKAGLANTA